MYRNRLTLPPHSTQTLSLTSASSLTLPHSLISALQHHFNPFRPLVPFPVIAPSCVWLHVPALAILSGSYCKANSENLLNLLRCACTCNESVLCSVLGHCCTSLLQLLLTSLTSLLWCSHTCAGGSETC